MNKNFLHALNDWSDIITNTYENANVYEVKPTIEENQQVVPDYYCDKNPDEPYKSTFKVPDGVTSIGWCAFARCKELYEIILPDSIKKFSMFVFYKCVNLKSINLPNGLKMINSNTFAQCKSLKTINFPKSLIYIGKEAFAEAGLEGLLEIPASVKTLGSAAFKSNENITALKLNDGLVNINNHVFSYCDNLAGEIHIPPTVTYIGPQAFATNKLITKIYVPKEHVENYHETWNARCYAEIIYY